MFAGLCDNCKHVQIVKSAKGSFFHLCMFFKKDPRFSKYPKLPVLACAGYQAREQESESSAGVSDTSDELQPP